MDAGRREAGRRPNLEGWTLSDEDGRTCTFRHVWPDGRTTLRVHTGFGRDTRTDEYQDRRRQVWDDDSDTATLRNDRAVGASVVSGRAGVLQDVQQLVCSVHGPDP